METGCYIAMIDDSFYPFFWDEERGQTKSLHGGWFANGHSARAIKYVSSPYKTRHSAYNAIWREYGKEAYNGIYIL